MEIKNEVLCGSSFIIKKDKIKPKKLNLLLNHSDYELYGEKKDAWEIDIKKDKDYIIGKTSTNNFNMEKFCFDNNIPVKFFWSEWAYEDYLIDINRNK